MSFLNDIHSLHSSKFYANLCLFVCGPPSHNHSTRRVLCLIEGSSSLPLCLGCSAQGVQAAISLFLRRKWFGEHRRTFTICSAFPVSSVPASSQLGMSSTWFTTGSSFARQTMKQQGLKVCGVCLPVGVVSVCAGVRVPCTTHVITL